MHIQLINLTFNLIKKKQIERLFDTMFTVSFEIFFLPIFHMNVNESYGISRRMVYIKNISYMYVENTH